MNSRITRSGDMPDFKLYDSFTNADIVSMKNERIHFLNSMKKCLQKMQEEAIQSAIKGKGMIYQMTQQFSINIINNGKA